MATVLVRVSLVLLLTLVLTACAALPRRGAAATQAGAPELSEMLVVGIRTEPETLALRPLRDAGGAASLPARMFNADLAILDDRGVALPYLVEALPELNTESWRVFPDGRMETTYRLKPDLVWHDGRPLSAWDFVFGWRVYRLPELGLARAGPFEVITDVHAADERTVVVRWQRPYPDAAHLAKRGQQLPALPRHVLEATLETGSHAALSEHPYWSRAFVGLGPYRLHTWVPGAYLEGVAFAEHALGPPKIERIRVVFQGDLNAAIAGLLAGSVQLLADSMLELEQGVFLRREWESRGRGRVVWHFTVWRGISFQFRPAYAQPEALLDVAVRRAIAHAIDREALNDAVAGGAGLLADFVLPPLGEWGRAAEQGVVTYPFDLRLVEQRMWEAGYERGEDGVLANALRGRLSAELRAIDGPEIAREVAAIGEGLRTAGLEVTVAIVSPALEQDPEARATYPALALLSAPASERTLLSFSPVNIPLPENRWRGGNRSGWHTPEYTRLIGLFTATLDPTERKEQLARMARLFTEDVAAVSLYFRPQVWAHGTMLSGLGDAPPETNMAWNIHGWTLRS